MKADFKVAISAPFAAKPQQGKPRAKKPKPAEAPASRPPRIATLMALAIHMDQLLREGHVKDQAELARLAGVTRARVTQAMNLLGLAPEIQEKLLFSTTADVQRKSHAERTFRGIARHTSWTKQCQLV